MGVARYGKTLCRSNNLCFQVNQAHPRRSKYASLAELTAIYERSLVNERTQELFACEAERWGNRARHLIGLGASVEAGEAARVAVGFARLAQSQIS